MNTSTSEVVGSKSKWTTWSHLTAAEVILSQEKKKWTVAKPRSNHCRYVAFRRADQPSKSITQHGCVVLPDETLKQRISSLAVLLRHKPKCPKWFQS